MWRIDDSKASLTLEDFSATVQLNRPDEGLFNIRHAGGPMLDCQFLRLKMLAGNGDPIELGTVSDSYTRGADVIATYSARHRLTPQIYWRSIGQVNHSRFCGVELIISLQTDLLDDRPQTVVGSSIACNEVLALNESTSTFEPAIDGDENHRFATPVFLYRFADKPCSFVEMAHPANLPNAELRVKPAESLMVVSRFDVLDGRLEKGVIRRDRMRGLFIDRGDDQSIALDAYNQFVNSAIPLTV